MEIFDITPGPDCGGYLTFHVNCLGQKISAHHNRDEAERAKTNYSKVYDMAKVRFDIRRPVK